MKAIIMAPYNAPIVADIPNRLKALQGWVGGFIEAYPIGNNTLIICNEEGKLKGLTPNAKIAGESFVGTILFVGTDGEDFCDCPITIRDVLEVIE